jgi:iron complex outermembrane recepter protein
MNPSITSPLSAGKRSAARALVVALALGLASIASAAELAKRSFNVPAADAEKSLKVFSEQARLEVLFPTALVSGVRTQRVSGDLPPREALTQMLAGTGLVAVQDATTGAFSVRKGATEPTSKNVEADPSRAARPIGPADVAKSALVTASGGVIELSPFVVGSSTDRGYQALNRMALRKDP